MGAGVVGTRRARRLVDEGHVWQARDLLEEHVESERDTEALTALGEVLHAMGDLPRAGAVWFAAGATGPEVDGAVAAWREQTGEDFVAMWRSLPASASAGARTTTRRPSSSSASAESYRPAAPSVRTPTPTTPTRGRAEVTDAARVRGERAMCPG